jgi:hypothetical protein
MASKKELSKVEATDLMATLKARFEKNMGRHTAMDWKVVESKLIAHPAKLWSLNQMEQTGGEPDVVILDKNNKGIAFCDCSAESPAGRRSYCYDKAALDARKENKPKHSALAMAEEMGIEILTEEQYRSLQKLGNFDLKTSSWVFTPPEIRKLGGAIFCDRRYDQVFVYHNGAESYYAARGFRGIMNYE